jgi:hypothetical protein
MLPKSVKFLLLLAAALTLGCASGPPFEPVTAVPPEKALIYVYRPPVFHGAAFSPGITINGKSVVALTSGGYVPYFADAGPIKVDAVNVGVRSINFEAKGGGTYYVKGGTVFMGFERRRSSSCPRRPAPPR